MGKQAGRKSKCSVAAELSAIEHCIEHVRRGSSCVEGSLAARRASAALADLSSRASDAPPSSFSRLRTVDRERALRERMVRKSGGPPR
jgi:hypothetical protein